METVFDIGMYDAADTIYYLEEGYKVVAVEANPNLIRRATEKLQKFIESGRVELVNAAIGPEGESATRIGSGDDMGASTIFETRVADKDPVGSHSVPTISIQELIHQHGVPHYLKVDIEGADRWCVLGLTQETRPTFLSFEMGEDAEDLVTHAFEIGYRRFKIINQSTFLELTNERRWYDRIARRMIKLMGYDEPSKIKRGRRFFTVSHSSGPAPWCSNGHWYPAKTAISRWRRAKEAGNLSAWYDIHAS